MKSRLTLIITCSAIPSHPNPVVLQTVLSSLFQYTPALLQCHLIIVFDGWKVVPEGKEASKQAAITESQRKNYSQFVDGTISFLGLNWGKKEWTGDWMKEKWAVLDMIGPDSPPPLVSMLHEDDAKQEYPDDDTRVTTATWFPITIPPTSKTIDNSMDVFETQRSDSGPVILTCLKVTGPRLGQALAVREAMQYVKTDYVFAMQHDWRMNEAMDISAFLDLMDTHTDINYLGFISRRTQGYASAISGRVGLPSAVIDPPIHPTIPLCRSFFWFDKNHIARAQFYKEHVFSGEYKFKRGDFIEDTMGHVLLKEVKEGGLEAWRRWGCFLYYPEEGKRNGLVHVNGRQYLSNEDKIELEESGRSGSTSIV